MNRFFITTLFTLLAATQLSSVNGMDRQHDDTIDLGTSSSASNLATTIKSLPPEIQLHAITWMLDVETPENLINSLIMMCNCALIDADINALATDQTLGYCLKTRLKNTRKSLTKLLNEYEETVLHLLARRQDFNARLFNVIQIAAGNQFNDLVSMQNFFQAAALHLAAYNGHTARIQALLNAPGVNTQQLVSMQNINQETALHFAARYGYTACVQTILNAPGVNAQQLVSMQDNIQVTALHEATWNGHTACVQAILNTPGVNTYQLVSMDINVLNILIQSNKKLALFVVSKCLSSYLQAHPNVTKTAAFIALGISFELWSYFFPAF